MSVSSAEAYSAASAGGAITKPKDHPVYSDASLGQCTYLVSFYHFTKKIDVDVFFKFWPAVPEGAVVSEKATTLHHQF